MNAGVCEQSLRRNFQTNATYQRLRSVPSAFSAFLIPHTSLHPILIYLQNNWSSLGLTSLPVSCHSCRGHLTFSFFKSREKTLGEHEGVFSSLRNHLWHWLLFSQSHTTSRGIVAVCNLGCCCMQCKLTREGTGKSSEGSSCFRIPLTPVFTRKETALVAHYWEVRRWRVIERWLFNVMYDTEANMPQALLPYEYQHKQKQSGVCRLENPLNKELRFSENPYKSQRLLIYMLAVSVSWF